MHCDRRNGLIFGSLSVVFPPTVCVHACGCGECWKAGTEQFARHLLLLQEQALPPVFGPMSASCDRRNRRTRG